MLLDRSYAHKPLFILCSLLALVSSVATYSQQQVPLTFKEWRGEILRKHEGALYLRWQATGFRNGTSGIINVTFYNIIQQKNLVISQNQAPVDSFPREMWRVPSGKYRIDRIDTVDGRGIRRTWQPAEKSKLLVLVPRNSLSNLGIWTMSPEGASNLKVTFADAKNTYSEENPKAESSIAMVVNGFTGIIQEVFGGKRVLSAALSQTGGGKELRAVASTTRQISMFFRLDLYKDNAFNSDVIQALQGFDSKLRGCYTGALNENNALRGNIVLKLLISEKTGTIRQIRRSGGSLVDGGLTNCLVKELLQIPLPVRKNMIGELSFMFDMTQK